MLMSERNFIRLSSLLEEWAGQRRVTDHLQLKGRDKERDVAEQTVAG
jgi:hypothetical protein